MAGTWTCSEDEDFGSLGNNKVIVTGGTSGSPAGFSDFVTADRAGEAVLMAATNGAKGMTLTYQIRGVEDLALLISFIVASKTADTDYVFITGTDFAGNAQTESIDVSAGNGTYVSTKYFKTITQIDCEDAGDGSGTAWADGTLRVTQPRWGFIWDYGDSQYKMECFVEVGDGSTSTYFGDSNFGLVLESGVHTGHYQVYFDVKNSATLRWGALDTEGDKTTKDGAYVNCREGSYIGYIAKVRSTGIIYLYGVHTRATYTEGVTAYTCYDNRAGDTLKRAWNCTFDNASLEDWHGSTNGDVYKCLLLNDSRLRSVGCSTDEITILDHAAAGVQIEANVANTTLSNYYIRNNLYVPRFQNMDYHAYCVDWDVDTWNPIIPSNSDGHVYRQYTCNISVTDKDGTLLDDVIVDCEDTNGTAVWTAGSVLTGATNTGKIDEQTITYKDYYYNAQEDTLSPHKFTISKVGYKTFVLDNITIDGVVDWHFELPDIDINEMQEESFLISQVETYVEEDEA
jgi:hypothetical protein